MEKRQRRRPFVMFLWGMVAINGLILWYGRGFISNGYGDFAAFYTAGKLLRTGQGANLYDRASEWQIQQQFASKVTIRKASLPYIRPPFEALVFAPLSFLPYPVACVVWIGISVLMLLAVPGTLGMPLAESLPVPAALRGLLCLSFVPVAISLLHGQDAVLLLLCFVLAFNALKRNADLQAGIFLGAGLFKFHLVLPLVAVFVLRKQWKVVTGVAAAAFVLILISIAIVGWRGVLAYPAYLWELNRAAAPGVVSASSMPNLRGLLVVLFRKRQLWPTASAALLAVQVLGVLLAARIWQGNRENWMSLSAGFGFIIAVTLFTSYYVYSYDMTLLLLPLLALVGPFLDDARLEGRPRFIFLTSAAILCCAPLYWLAFFGIGDFCWFVLPMLGLAVSLVLAAERLKDLHPIVMAGMRTGTLHSGSDS